MDEKDLVTLSDDLEYCIAKKCVIDDKIFYVFVELNNLNNIKYMYALNGNESELTEVTDMKTVDNIIKLCALK